MANGRHPWQAFVQTDRSDSEELDDWNQITETEVRVAAEMTGRNELSGGTPVVREFEERWRSWIGSKYCLTTVNGTSALYSAYFGLGIGPGDEVICPTNTWIGSIAAVPFLGARPVFCDIDPDTLLMDPADVERRITDRTACICAVHLWGNVCNLEELLAIGRRHGIPVLEDCAHAHGARYKDRMCGSFGKVSCWSLQGSKPVSAGEGGILVTDDADVFDRACLLGQVNRIAGVDLVSGQYDEHQPLGLGMKFRAHPLGIGIANVQLDKLEQLNRSRRAFIEAIESGLDAIPGLRAPAVLPDAERGGFYGFPIIHEAEEGDGSATQAIAQALSDAGVPTKTRPYPSLHDLPLYAKGFDLFTRNRGPLLASEGYKGYAHEDFPGANLAQARTLFLPRLNNPRPHAVEFVLETLSKVMKNQPAPAKA